MIVLPARFLDKVEVGDCWAWTGGMYSEGYGSYWTGAKNVRAHRFCYETLVGPVPDGLVLDHLCRNRLCVNPDHLEPVTNRTNVVRGWSPQTAKQACPSGHPYSPENTYVYTWKSGRTQRMCRTCNRDRQRERRAAL